MSTNTLYCKYLHFTLDTVSLSIDGGIYLNMRQIYQSQSEANDMHEKKKKSSKLFKEFLYSFMDHPVSQ